MKFYKLHYFVKGVNGICADDFKRKRETDIVNISLVSSVSMLQQFFLVSSKAFIGAYAVVAMSNGIKYWIDEKSLNNLSEVLDNYTPPVMTLEDCENEAISFTNGQMKIAGGLLSEDYKTGYKEGIEHYLAFTNDCNLKSTMTD